MVVEQGNVYNVAGFGFGDEFFSCLFFGSAFNQLCNRIINRIESDMGTHNKVDSRHDSMIKTMFYLNIYFFAFFSDTSNFDT